MAFTTGIPAAIAPRSVSSPLPALFKTVVNAMARARARRARVTLARHWPPFGESRMRIGLSDSNFLPFAR